MYTMIIIHLPSSECGYQKTNKGSMFPTFYYLKSVFPSLVNCGMTVRWYEQKVRILARHQQINMAPE